MSVQYKVYMTPLVSARTYGDEIDVSDYVLISDGEITRSIDSTDFNIALYTFNDITLVCDNAEGKFSDPADTRSLFPYSRDLAKIRIVYEDSESTAKLTYKGLINEEATAIDLETDQVSFLVLGVDSVLRKSQVPNGAVTSGMTVKNAILAILSAEEVRAVLTVSIDNINPFNNVTVDIGEKFDKVARDKAINELLGASNSIMIIDDDDVVYVRSRAENSEDDNGVVYLYGKADLTGRENIIGLKNFNTGLQRLFNSITVSTGNDPEDSVTEVHDDVSIGTYGLRPKSFTFNWLDAVNNLANVRAVAQSILDYFKFPKYELEVEVPTELVAESVLLDLVSVNYPLFANPTGKFLPIVGVTPIGDTDSPLPRISGALAIDPSLAFKIIEKREQIESFTTVLKLRQIGTESDDGVFTMSVPINLSILNNQASVVNLTGLSFSSAEYRGVVIQYDLKRKTASSERRAIGRLEMVYDSTASSWSIVKNEQADTDTETGVTFSVTAAGQLQYTSDNQSGASYEGTMKAEIVRTFDA